ncbi:MAG: shikimate dehydrogenase [Candidatus Azotimanducaceae bacterium]
MSKDKLTKQKVARLAVFGNPIAHSLSPEIHRQFATQSGVRLEYERILVPEGKFAATADAFLAEGKGFNITVPCKIDAYGYAKELSAAASDAQAVNTISLNSEGKVFGDNTDGQGLLRDITANLGWQVEGRHILLLGAGGAASGVLPSLLAAGPTSVHVYNRTHKKAVDLVKRFKQRGNVVAVKQADFFEGYDLVINGTSAGLAGGSVDLPGDIIDSETRCYDMIYGADTTVFNAWCLDQADCVVADGLGMLVEQAALAFKLWFDQRVETFTVINEIRSSIGSR